VPSFCLGLFDDEFSNGEDYNVLANGEGYNVLGNADGCVYLKKLLVMM